MDPHSATQTTPQTIAQAVQAATQQAQQIAHSSPQAQTTQSSTIDNLTCQWQGCGERCDTAETLYDHVCERHVGRKSTNNLNLTCQWGACRTTTVKRDHITSHIRVHVPLKPHKCDFCQKAFKRPQDLKKHVKTHADDSVLMDSPQHGQGGRVNGGGLQHQTNGKPTSGYYPASHDVSLSNPYPSYQPAMTAGLGHGASYAHAGANGQYAGYGNVSYPNSAAMADIQSLDTRRRAIEALNDFLGDIKRRAIDPGNYYDVGQRLQTNALPLPVGTGYNTGYSSNNYNANYNTASLLESFNNGGSLHHNLGPQTQSLSTPGYSLPLPNARTKSDLQDIDRFLEQLQSTVYENTTAASAAGVHPLDNGSIAIFGHAGPYRPSHSPPHAFSDSLTSGSSVATASSIDTPVQTPSSISSYHSASLSPVSSHSRTSYGGSAGGSLTTYPSLPVGSNYPTTNSAPVSVLAHDFNNVQRRHSHSRLHKAPPADVQDRDVEMLDAEDSGNKTPRADDADSVKKEDNSIDPALRDEEDKASTPVASSESDQDKRQEQWVENIRVIEALRKWISERIKQGEFEDENVASSEAREPSEEDLKTVETAKMVAEKLAGAEIAAKDVEALVEYPKLPSSS